MAHFICIPCAVAAASFLLSVCVADSTKATLVKHSLSKYPHAKCFDGSPAAYYHQWFPGSSKIWDSPHLWIINLEGGGWCWDTASCEARCGTPTNVKAWDVCTSKNYPQTISTDGIIGNILANGKNEILSGTRSVVHLKYCTGDAHMGNATEVLNGWQMRGHAVVQAMLDDLGEKFYFGRDPRVKDLVVWSGQSAGGRGAMVHLEYVKGMILQSNHRTDDNIEVVGFLDSPLWLDIAPMFPPPHPGSWPGDAVTTRGVYSLSHPLHLGELCKAKYAAEPWKCIFGEYRLGAIEVETPFVLVASSDDAFQVYENLHLWHFNLWPSTKEQFDYVRTNISERTIFDVEGLAKEFASGPVPRSIVSWACYDHAVSASHWGFESITAPRYDPVSHRELANIQSSARDALEALLQSVVTKKWKVSINTGSIGETDGVSAWIDTCTDFNCGKGCPKSRQPMSKNRPFGSDILV